jgi:VCBS repeat protein
MSMRAAVAVVLACLGLILGLGMSLGGCVIYLNPLCTDQITNGDETGVDCGGTCSAKCELGGGCKTDGDCDDANCVGGVCTAKPCANGVQDAQETDVDCGGGTCRACAGGRKCLVDADCFGMSCSMMTHTCSALSVAFAPEVRYPSGHKAYALLLGDLDGDNHADLAVINEYGSSIAVFRNDFSPGGMLERVDSGAGKQLPPDDPGTGNFGPTGAYPTGGGLADFNRDGHLDVVTADYHGNSVTILLNDGTGKLKLPPPATCPGLHFASCSYPTLANAATQSIAVGDLNKDGNPDVVATNPQTASVSVFLDHADGTLAPAINLPVGVTNGAQPYSAVIADFDGDGNNDLAISEETSGTIIVRLGHGDATFGPEAPYAIDGTRDYFIIAADMNKDGKLDLVCANRNGDTVSVLLGRGDGTFRKAIVSSVGPPGVTLPGGRPWFGPYTVAAADVNHDGVLDLVTPNFVGNSVSVLLGIGDGHFDPAVEFKFSAATTPYDIVVGDFNGDGKPDLATANTASDDLAIRLSTGEQH